MKALTELPAWDGEGRLRVVVESPKGSPFKYKYEPEARAFELQRRLPDGLNYPHDWGFVPGTQAEDGDPLDAMVLCDAGTWPGVVIPSQPIAVLKISDKKPSETRGRENHRIIAVPDFATEQSGALLPDERRALEQFLVAVGRQIKEVNVLGWGDAAEARTLISRLRRS